MSALPPKARTLDVKYSPSDGWILLIRPRSVDHFLERNVFFALGAADQAHLLEVVLGLEEVALFGMPHAVIGPGQSVFGIGGKRRHPCGGYLGRPAACCRDEWRQPQ